MAYIVVQHGVYMQGIYGLYGELREAVEAAQRYAMNDEDNYHEWEVHYLRDGKWYGTGWEYHKSATYNEVRVAEEINKGMD